MKPIKYLVIAGTVKSAHDGDFHKISAPQLCRLYGVNPSECIFADEDRLETFVRCDSKLIRLYPKDKGDYKLPEINKD